MSCCFGEEDPPPRQVVQNVQQPAAAQPPCATIQLTPPPSEASFTRKPLPVGCKRFTYLELSVATKGFSERYLVGEGGFGKVYQGTLPDGEVVAIKCLDRLGLQGDKEFNVEVNILGRLRHENLVTLLGACTENRHRLAVFEFMPGGSLRDCLDHMKPNRHGHVQGTRLLWPARVGVALGAARGLAYLHEGSRPGLIHRDVKSCNVLIDSLGHARIADFGLAMHTGSSSGLEASAFKLQPCNEAELLTGTYGYSAPEYIRGGRIQQKSDVYSFGVVLLELLVGRPPVDGSRPVGCQMLVDEMLPILQRGNIEELQECLDPDLPAASIPVPQLAAFSEVAHVCLQMNPNDRPRMSRVVTFLEAIAGWKESVSDRNSNRRHTLSSLMDAMADVPPVGAADIILAPLGPQLSGEAAGWVAGSPQTTALTANAGAESIERLHSAGLGGELLQARPSYGPEAWPSMPLSPTAAAPEASAGQLAASEHVARRQGSRHGHSSGGNPFSDSALESDLGVRSALQSQPRQDAEVPRSIFGQQQHTPSAAAATNWVSFEQFDGHSSTPEYSSSVADPAHIWLAPGIRDPAAKGLLVPTRSPPQPPC